MTTNWKIQIDWDRDGDFTTAIDDITDYVMSAKWVLGLQKPYQEVAQEMTLGLILRNSDRRFSPENKASPLAGKVRPQVPARVVSDDGVTERVMWTGWVQTLKPTVGKHGERTMKILCAGAVEFYTATETKIELQENKRTDEIIAQLVAEVVYPPKMAGMFILGVPGHTELDETTRLGEAGGASNLETGQLTLGYAADNWVRQGGYTNQANTGYDVYRGIRDIVAAERGRFFFDREGAAVFWNRHHTQLATEPVKAMLDDTMQGMDYVYAGADYLKNEIVVIAHPRTISESDQEVLWELGSGVIRVKAAEGDNPAEAREIYAAYKDENDTRVGAKDVTVTDIEYEDGCTGPVTVEIDERANGALLKLTNTGTKDALVKKLIVRGRKIVDRGRLEATANDGISQGRYGRRTLRLNLSSLDNLDDAQYIADYELTRRSTPRGMATSVVLKSHAFNGGNQHAAQLDVTVGDRVTITETQTGHSDTYIVIGESHQLEGPLYTMQWYLEPQPVVTPGLVGVAGRNELGVSMIVGF
jgi:hypothetical protein